jgi:hypothetical protein
VVSRVKGDDATKTDARSTWIYSGVIVFIRVRNPWGCSGTD